MPATPPLALDALLNTSPLTLLGVFAVLTVAYAIFSLVGFGTGLIASTPLAWAMPVVAAMTIWSWLFDWRRGLVNWVLGTSGHNWLENPLSFFMVAGIIVIWMSVPFVAFSVYAGLTQVPNEVLEAAAMDGASPLQQLFRIVMPMIKPVLGIVFLLQIIWDLRVFTQIYMLQGQGSNPSETNLLGTYIYQLGVGRGDFGTASAVSIFVLGLTVLLSWGYVRYLIKEESDA